jgi:hypothetical protein
MDTPALDNTRARWLPRGNEVHAEVRLPQAAGPRDAGCHAGAEFPAGEAGRAADVSCLRKSKGDGRF